MARRVLLAFLLAAMFAGSIVVSAQRAASAPSGQAKSQSTQPSSSVDRAADSIARVTLGQSAVPLYGPWKFNVGDSPIHAKTGRPLWAEPEFDDSRWDDVDPTPKVRAIDPTYGVAFGIIGVLAHFW
jgi:hypothetical protein